MNSEQRKVRKFYKEFLTWSADNVGLWLAAGFFGVLYLVFAAVPYQEMLEERAFLILPLMFGFLMAFFYLKPYLTFQENTESFSIYERIKYLPVDLREIQKMRVIYLAKFVLKVAPVLILVQLFTSHFSYEITLEVVLYAIFEGILWPFLSNLPIAWFSK